MNNRSPDQKFPDGVEYINNRIKEMASEYLMEPPRWIQESAQCLFRVDSRTQKGVSARILFGETMLEALDAVIARNDRSNYGLRFRYFADFTVYLGLVEAGMLRPVFEISRKFFEEKQERNDWRTDGYGSVSLAKDLARIIYEGLKKLESLLSNLLEKNSDIGTHLQDLDEDLQRVVSIKDYYESHDESLDEDRASMRSLGILKAAAIREIVERERRKKEQTPSVINVELDRAIASVVRILREGLFLEAPLPDWLKSREDFSELVDLRESVEKAEAAPYSLSVFISATSSDLDDVRRRLAVVISELPRTKAINSEDPAFHDGSLGLPSDDICLKRVEDASDFLLLVYKEAGSDYAGRRSEYKGLKITHAETKRAVDQGKRVHCFIRIETYTYYKCWKENGRLSNFICDGIDKSVFVLLDYIFELREVWWITYVHLPDLEEKVKARLAIMTGQA